ncbi:GxxExxY protein [Thermodesulfobacteriota bacterium]
MERCFFKKTAQILFNRVNENALLAELKNQGLEVDSQVPIKVLYKENIVGEYFADIVVEKKVIVEIKAVELLRSYLKIIFSPNLGVGVSF